jgi:DNA-binding LacI/PurR family transcriptional regulator
MSDGRQVSIIDIARAAGVSHSTVSRALNDNPVISSDMRHHIQTLAMDMGYTPNALAQSLHSRLSHSIGLIITTIADPFFVEVVHGVEEVALENNYSIFLASSHNDPEKELKIVDSFIRRRVDGVILASSRIGSDHTRRLNHIRIPVVMINNQAEDEYIYNHSVSVDDYDGALLAVRHLLALGHRRIGYIGVSNRPGSNERRLQGYLQAMQEAEVSIQPGWICLDKNPETEDLQGDVRLGKNLAPRLLDAGVTAIFCYCDTVAVGALAACHNMGISVPAQVSIIGFDDGDLCNIVIPPLTTISQPKREMGQIAMKTLLTGINGGQVSGCILEPTLVIRQSTAPLQNKFVSRED